jgi:hypothetical protein
LHVSKIYDVWEASNGTRFVPDFMTNDPLAQQEKLGGGGGMHRYHDGKGRKYINTA